MLRGWIWTLPLIRQAKSVLGLSAEGKLIRQAKSVVGFSAEGKQSGFHALLQRFGLRPPAPLPHTHPSPPGQVVLYPKR